MGWLPLANILHHKLRSALSALGIGIAVCMLITLTGLSRGSLFEVAQRWESVDADLIVLPRGWGDNASDKSGSGLPDRYAAKIAAEMGDKVRRVVAVFTWQIKLAGQDQMSVGVDGEAWQTLSGGKRITQGRLFDPQGKFDRWLRDKLLRGGQGDGQVLELTEQDLCDPQHNGLEMVIDSRLASAGGYRLGQTVFTANHHWQIVGIVQAGAMARVFLPRATAQYLFGNGDMTRSTLMFVKLADGLDPGPAARAIAKLTGQDVVPLARYRGMLMEKFGIMFTYVDAVNVVALVIAFLFIMVTLYTMVLQRTREIAILKSAGASNLFLARQVAAESMMLTGLGAAAGVGLSFLAARAIQAARPLLTVTITWKWIAIAFAAALIGALASTIYPAWRAGRVDMAEVLSLE
jgi:ABC-type lipoprotein release transport system permease subunit